VYANFLAKFLVVSSAESTHRSVIDTAKLATWVVVVEHIVGWKFAIDSLAIAAFYCVDAIVFTIK
jgi:hypothetical protein